jgi:hypothetical protein
MLDDTLNRSGEAPSMNEPALRFGVLSTRLLTLAAAMLAALCFALSGLPGPTAVGAQAGPAVHITAPANGATVTNPVTVTVQSSGAVIKPATDNDPNAAHYHYFVDRNPASVLQQGQPIPTGQPDIIHTDSPNQQLPNLSPGQHTVWVVLAHTDHTPYNPNVQDQVTFTVAAPGQAAAPPQTAAAPSPPVVGRGGLLPAAERAPGVTPRLARAVNDRPWLPVVAALAIACAALGAGVSRMRQPRARP